MSIWPTSEENALVAAKLGGFNDMPPFWKEITESEYYWRWSVMPAKRIYQFRQVQFSEREPYRNTSLFVHPVDFSGIGFYLEYDGRATRTEIDAYKPRYFKWALCEHEFETITQRMSYWVGRCTKCGYEKAVDSSG